MSQKNVDKRRRNLILTLASIVLFMLLTVVLNITLDSYIKRILNLCAIYTIVSLGMNLVNGFTGQFSLGQAGFMAIGAYSVAVFTLPMNMREQVFYMAPMNPLIANIHMPLWLALITGGLISAFIAMLIGLPVLRLKGDYLAIATLGFSEIIRIVLTNVQTFTNGALGIKGIPSVSNMSYIFGVALISVIFLALLLSSSYGRAFKAIREDEIAAEAMGVGLLKHKLMAFMISAFFTGVGGGLYGALLGTVDPKNFMFTLTYNFLLIIVLGGLGSISGTVMASFLVTGGLEVLRIFDDENFKIFGATIPLFRPGFRMVVFSIILVVVVLFWRTGIMGKNELTWDKILQNPLNHFKKKKKEVV